jgi:Uncharacterized homolog of gamma-carboxymuconolactone decarboxylase subunit
VFGTLWSRGGHDRRSHSLVTLSILIAQKSSAELKYHFSISLKNGIMKAKIDEIENTK